MLPVLLLTGFPCKARLDEETGRRKEGVWEAHHHTSTVPVVVAVWGLVVVRKRGDVALRDMV